MGHDQDHTQFAEFFILEVYNLESTLYASVQCSSLCRSGKSVKGMNIWWYD
jgi:hypothetical protein